MYSLEALIAILILLLPGFLALQIILRIIVTKEEIEIGTAEQVLYSLALVVLIYFFFNKIFPASITGIFSNFNFAAQKKAFTVFQDKYVSAILILLVFSAVIAVIFGFIIQGIIAWIRTLSGQARISKRKVWQSAFGKKDSAWIILIFEKVAYMGQVKMASRDAEKSKILIFEPSIVPIGTNGIPDPSKKKELNIKHIYFDASKANAIWFLNTKIKP